MSQSFSQDRLKRLQLQYIEIETISLSKFSSKQQLRPVFTASTGPVQSAVLQRLAGQDLKEFAGEANSNLLAYSYMLLSTIYDTTINEDLLGLLKSLLYDQSLALTDVCGHPFSDLSNAEMKKLIVEFVFELQFADHTKVLPRALERHPIVLHILALFLRTMLVRFGMGEAGSYSQAIPAESAFEVLSELLGISFRPVDSSYLFPQSRCVIHEKSGGVVLVGHYFESKPVSLASEPRDTVDNKEMLKIPSFSRKDHNFNFQSNIRESLCNDYDAPTPFFNLSGEQRSDLRQRDTQQLKAISSVPELKMGFRVSEDEQEEGNQSFEEKLKMLKSQENGWKSPIFNNGIILDDADNAFHLFEVAQRDAFTRKTSKKSLDNQLRLETEESNNDPCSCSTRKKRKNKLDPRLYEVNLLNLQRQYEEDTEQLPSFDCMMFSIKNVLSVQASSCETPKSNITRRAHTFYEFHANSISDLDRSFESYDPHVTRSNLNKTCIYQTPSYMPTKQQSRVVVHPSVPARMPKIKFTYTSKKL